MHNFRRITSPDLLSISLIKDNFCLGKFEFTAALDLDVIEVIRLVEAEYLLQLSSTIALRKVIKAAKAVIKPRCQSVDNRNLPNQPFT